MFKFSKSYLDFYENLYDMLKSCLQHLSFTERILEFKTYCKYIIFLIGKYLQ